VTVRAPAWTAPWSITRWARPGRATSW
jgi:hypothetical protein